ncbi:MAG: hypothetical protein V5A55_14670 [Halovenus sp.]
MTIRPSQDDQSPIKGDECKQGSSDCAMQVYEAVDAANAITEVEHERSRLALSRNVTEEAEEPPGRVARRQSA